MDVIEDSRFRGNLRVNTLEVETASLTQAAFKSSTAFERSKLAQDTLQPYVVNFADFRVHDAIATLLPSAAANDDLGFDGGTFGTEAPHLTAGDVKTTSSTRYGRFLVRLPMEYDDGETVTLRLKAGMLTTVADGSCTVDVEAYKCDGETGVGSDLCATAAQSINSLTFADKDFIITGTGLVSGDLLDIRIAVAYVDTATGTAVEPVVGKVSLLADVKG